MKRIGMCIVVGVILFAGGRTASAGICEAAESSEFMPHLGGRLTRGIANSLFGWTQFFHDHEPQDERWHQRALTNFSSGVRETIHYTAVGLGEVATFWAPPGVLDFTDKCIVLRE